MQMQTFAQWGASGFFLMNSNAKRKLKNSVFHSAQLQSVCAGSGGRREGGTLECVLTGGGLGQGGTFLLSGWQTVLVRILFFDRVFLFVKQSKQLIQQNWNFKQEKISLDKLLDRVFLFFLFLKGSSKTVQYLRPFLFWNRNIRFSSP